MDVTVVVPVYNGERYIAAALQSVFAQTRLPREVIVVDDGSTDRTASVIMALGVPVRMLHQENRGVSAARNRGIQEARSAWVALLDADDRWHSGKLERFASTQARHPRECLFYSDVRQIDEEGRVEGIGRAPEPGENLLPRLLRRNFIVTSTAIFLREAALASGLFREDFICRAGVEDWEFFLRLANQGPVARVPGTWTDYRRHRASAIQTQRFSLREDANRVITLNAHWAKPELLAEARTQVFLDSGLRHLTAGDLVSARADFISAFRGLGSRTAASFLWTVTFFGGPTVRFMLVLRRAVRRLFSVVAPPRSLGSDQ